MFGLPLSEIALLVLALIGAGLFGGIIAGLFGVGGGTVLVPVLFYAFTVLGVGGEGDLHTAIGTSLATIVFTSLASGLGHHRKGAIDTALLKLWAPSILVGVVIGSVLGGYVSGKVLIAVFAVVALAVSADMILRKGRADPEPKGFSRPVWAAFGVFAGGVSAMMGIGGGSFGVPLMSLFNVPIHRAVATAAGFGGLIAVPSVIGFLLVDATPNSPPLTVGAVNLPTFAIVIAMTLITAPLGVKLAHAMDPKPLKRVFAVFLILVALNMLRKSLGL